MAARHLLFTVLLSFFAETGIPCECRPRSIADEIQDAEMVMHGTVIKEEKKADFYSFTVVVKKKYKSTVKADTLVVRTHINPTLTCDAVLELHKSYIFYVWSLDLTKPVPEFRTRTCSRTRPFDATEEKEILKALNH